MGFDVIYRSALNPCNLFADEVLRFVHLDAFQAGKDELVEYNFEKFDILWTHSRRRQRNQRHLGGEQRTGCLSPLGCHVGAEINLRGNNLGARLSAEGGIPVQEGYFGGDYSAYACLSHVLKRHFIT